MQLPNHQERISALKQIIGEIDSLAPGRAQRRLAAIGTAIRSELSSVLSEERSSDLYVEAVERLIYLAHPPQRTDLRDILASLNELLNEGEPHVEGVRLTNSHKEFDLSELLPDRRERLDTGELEALNYFRHQLSPE